MNSSTFLDVADLINKLLKQKNQVARKKLLQQSEYLLGETSKETTCFYSILNEKYLTLFSDTTFDRVLQERFNIKYSGDHLSSLIKQVIQGPSSENRLLKKMLLFSMKSGVKFSLFNQVDSAQVAQQELLNSIKRGVPYYISSNLSLLWRLREAYTLLAWHFLIFVSILLLQAFL